MNALFSRLHLALVEKGDGKIGVSFPAMRSKPSNLGDVLRLHSSAANLKNLMELDWLRGVRDHVVVDELRSVPATAEHRRLRRVQPKGSPQRLARRYAKRHGVSEAEALALYAEMKEDLLRLPFLKLRSSSTGQIFSLFVDRGPAQKQPTAGSFNSYGLSEDATVPWF